MLAARPDRGDLFAVLGADVTTVRQIQSRLNEGRAACVRDECVCDAQGSTHPAHAHIGLCNELRDHQLSRDSEDFIQIQQDVRFAFLHHLEWAATEAAATALKKQHPNLA
jgi:hypothetical protein